MNNLSIKELDELQVFLVDDIREEFKKRNIKCSVVYCGMGQKLDKRDITIYVYKDKYNYSIIGYMFNPEIKADAYCTKALIDIEKGECKEYKASPEEVYIVEILEATKCKDLYVFDGELSHALINNVVVDMTSIESLNYSKTEAIITLIEDSGEKFIVNLATERIEWIEGEN